MVKTTRAEAVSDFLSGPLQDYLLSHMYANAARDDLWSKLSQVSFTWRLEGSP